MITSNKINMKHLINLIANLKSSKDLKNIKYKKTKDTQELFNILVKEGYFIINNIEILSKPGRRKYVTKEELRTVERGLGTTIVRTAYGLKTTHQARLLNLGGELLIKVI